MPDGRFLSKSIAHDWELNTVSFQADYLFARMIPHLDVEGRMPGHPGQVKAMTVPLRDELTPQAVDTALAELADAGLIVWYEVDARHYIAFPKFQRHQKGLRKDREADSVIPPPTHPEADRIVTVIGHSGPNPEGSRNVAASSPRSCGVSEVKVSEVKPSAAPQARESEPKAEKLSEYVGDPGIVSRFVKAHPQNAKAIPSILATWVRGSLTGEQVWKGVPDEHRKRILGDSIEGFAGEGKAYKANLFQAFVERRVSKYHQNPKGYITPDYGNETTRDRARASKAARRHRDRSADRSREEEKKLEKLEAKWEAWWEDADADVKGEIQRDVDQRLATIRQGLPNAKRRPILKAVVIEAMQKEPEMEASAA